MDLAVDIDSFDLTGMVFSGLLQLPPNKSKDNYKFELFPISQDRKTGMFVARGEDYLGTSAILGAVREGEVTFTQTYLYDVFEGGFHRRVGEDVPNFLDSPLISRVVKYAGNMSKQNGIIIMKGDCQVLGNRNNRGVWELSSVR